MVIEDKNINERRGRGLSSDFTVSTFKTEYEADCKINFETKEMEFRIGTHGSITKYKEKVLNVGNDNCTVLLIQSDETAVSNDFFDCSVGGSFPNKHICSYGNVYHDPNMPHFGASSIRFDEVDCGAILSSRMTFLDAKIEDLVLYNNRIILSLDDTNYQFVELSLDLELIQCTDKVNFRFHSFSKVDDKLLVLGSYQDKSAIYDYESDTVYYYDLGSVSTSITRLGQYYYSTFHDYENLYVVKLDTNFNVIKTIRFSHILSNAKIVTYQDLLVLVVEIKWQGYQAMQSDVYITKLNQELEVDEYGLILYGEDPLFDPYFKLHDVLVNNDRVIICCDVIDHLGSIKACIYEVNPIDMVYTNNTFIDEVDSHTCKIFVNEEGDYVLLVTRSGLLDIYVLRPSNLAVKNKYTIRDLRGGNLAYLSADKGDNNIIYSVITSDLDGFGIFVLPTSYSNNIEGYSQPESLMISEERIRLSVYYPLNKTSQYSSDFNLSIKPLTEVENDLYQYTNCEYNFSVEYVFPILRLSRCNAGLLIPYSRDFDFSVNDFTIDFWIYFDIPDSIKLIMSFGNTLQTASLVIWLDESYHIIAHMYSDIYSRVVLSSRQIAPRLWHHIAIVRFRNNFLLFVDGRIHANVIRRAFSLKIPPEDSYLCIGSLFGEFSFEGYLDEIRVSNGRARWLNEFTPPDKKYTPTNYPNCYSKEEIVCP